MRDHLTTSISTSSRHCCHQARQWFSQVKQCRKHHRQCQLPQGLLYVAGTSSLSRRSASPKTAPIKVNHCLGQDHMSVPVVLPCWRSAGWRASFAFTGCAPHAQAKARHSDMATFVLLASSDAVADADPSAAHSNAVAVNCKTRHMCQVTGAVYWGCVTTPTCLWSGFDCAH